MNHDKAIRQIKKSRKAMLIAEIESWKKIIFDPANDALYVEKLAEFNARKRLLRAAHAAQMLDIEQKHEADKVRKTPALSQSEIQKKYRGRIKDKKTKEDARFEFLKTKFAGKTIDEVAKNLTRNINDKSFELALQKMDYLRVKIRELGYI